MVWEATWMTRKNRTLTHKRPDCSGRHYSSRAVERFTVSGTEVSSSLRAASWKRTLVFHELEQEGIFQANTIYFIAQLEGMRRGSNFLFVKIGRNLWKEVFRENGSIRWNGVSMRSLHFKWLMDQLSDILKRIRGNSTVTYGFWWNGPIRWNGFSKEPTNSNTYQSVFRLEMWFLIKGSRFHQ